MNPEKLQQILDEEQPEDDIYERFSDAEDLEDYRQDGYHPVSIGDKFNGRYIAIQKLGWGHFSTVWLAEDSQNPKEFYALKIQKSKESYQEAARDEIDLLNDLKKFKTCDKWLKIIEKMNSEEEKEDENGQKIAINDQRKSFKVDTSENYTVNLIDNFTHFGMHGKHYCSTFELVGPTLLDLINHFDDRDKKMDLWLVKLITRQILVGLVYMHEVCDIIHTDIKPENIMIQFTPQNYDNFIYKYEKLPLSMKFLQVLRESNSGKNKKKYDKKKKKKAAQKAALKEQEENQNKPQEEEETKQQQQPEQQNQETQQQQQNKEQSKQEEIQNQQQEEEQKKEEEQKQNGEKQQQEEKEEEKQQQENEEAEGEGDWESQGSQEDDYTLLWKNDVMIPLDKDLKIKIVDFGNATWHKEHFTDRIQTREYRSPEGIIRADYEYNTDVWSLACMVFELITNNFLFKPKPGDGYKKNDHHLCMMIETLGKFPKQFALSGKKSRNFFNKGANLINIKDIDENTEPISRILVEDFDISVEDATEIEDFLTPMLQIDPKKRASAKQALEHPWLWN